MSIGYNLVLPSMNVYKLRVKDNEERMALVNELCEQWRKYCVDHWLSNNHDEPYCAENRVKRFLDGIAYFMMIGDTKGIVTEYREKANANREIPVSNCPSFIEDRIYGGDGAQPTEDDRLYMKQMREELDERAAKIGIGGTRKDRKKQPTKYGRLQKIKEQLRPKDFIFPIVDTDGNFTVNGAAYHVADDCEAYQPKQVKDDLLYDMDRVTVAVLPDNSLRFFDMNYEPIDGFVKNGSKMFLS